jgi:uncharacterized membrane protein YkvA (DUF1232 family)
MSWLSSPSLVRTLVARLRLAVRLLRDPGVPLFAKAFPVFAALYVISPLDFVPDFLPVLGQLDDLGVTLIVLEAFLKLCPARAVDFHRTALARNQKYCQMPGGGEIIDAEFRREETRR